MAAAGALVAAALHAVRRAAAPGVSTLDLDDVAEAVIRDGRRHPVVPGLPRLSRRSICSSVNDRVVHGIPSADEVLAAGDLVSIDCGAILDGWHGDSAVTFGVGRADPGRRGAVRGHPRCPWRPGSRPWCPATGSPTSRTRSSAAPTPPRRSTTASTASSRATAGTASAARCTWTRSCPTRAQPGRGPLLAAGSVLAIEPMLTLGTVKTRILDDEWTVVTADGSRAAHWEHTVAVTEDGPRILTLPGVRHLRGALNLRTSTSCHSAEVSMDDPDGADAGALRRARRRFVALCGAADRRPARAEDVVQETLLRAWQHPEVPTTRAITRGRGCSPSPAT